MTQYKFKFSGLLNAILLFADRRFGTLYAYDFGDPETHEIWHNNDGEVVWQYLFDGESHGYGINQYIYEAIRTMFGCDTEIIDLALKTWILNEFGHVGDMELFTFDPADYE